MNDDERLMLVREEFLAALEDATPGEVSLLARVADLAVGLLEIEDLPEERLDEAPQIARRALDSALQR